MAPRGGPPGGPGPVRPGGTAALAGAAAVAGWVLHDLARFLVSGEPALALAILPPSALLVACGAAVVAAAERALRGRPRWLGAGLVLLGMTLAALPLPLVEARIQLVRAAWLLAGLAGGVALVAPASPRLVLRLALAGGALGSVALSALRVGLEPSSWIVAAAALLVLAAGLVRRGGARRTLTAVVVLAAAGGIGREALASSRLTRAPLPPGPSAPAHPGPDLLLVVLDTVRADRLAPYGYRRVTTPRLDAFAAERAQRFERAWSTSSWTLPSHGSLFTGLFPSEHGATHPRSGRNTDTVRVRAAPAQRLRGDVPTLAETLRARGWRTGAILANYFFLDPRFGLDRGFEHYDARPGGSVKGHLPLSQLAGQQQRAGYLSYRDARTITDLALDWLAAPGDGRPTFLTVNYCDAHSPYIPPPPFDRAFGGERVAEPLLLRHSDRSLLYDQALLYIDSQLGRLLGAVDDDTLVIVTSDHGEALGDHDYWMHGWTVRESVVRVPLYVALPGGRPALTSDVPATSADVFHIALAGLGLSEAWAPSEGAILSEWFQVLRVPPELAERPVRRDLVAWLEGSLKVVVSSTGEVQVFDLEADPGELAPLPLEDARVEAACARAGAWWAERPPPALTEVELRAEDLERMEELGYMGGS